MYDLHKSGMWQQYDDLPVSEAEKYASGIFIDVPYDKNEDSVKYVADQLRELKAF